MSNSESTSVAVEILEDLCRKGSLTEEEKEKYKNEYDKLHRAVAESYASENELLRKAKELNIELTQGMIEVEKLSIGQADDVAAIKEMKSALRELTTEVQTAAEKEAVCMLQALEVSNDLVSVKEDMDDQEAYERSLLQQHVEKLNSVSSEASNKLSKSREGKAAVEAGIKELEQEMAELKEKVKIEKDGLKEAVAEFERIGREPERLAQEIARNLEKLGKIKTAIENEKKEIKKAHVKVEKHEETIKELKEEGRPLKMRIQNIEDTVEVLNRDVAQSKLKLARERERYIEEVSRKVGLDMQLRQCRDKLMSAENEVDQKDRQLYRAKRDTKKAMMKRERAEVALKVVEEDMKEVVEVAEKLAKESEAQESLLVEVKTEVEVFMAAFMKQESIDHHKKMDYRGLLVKSDEQQKELQALAKAEAAASQRERLLVGQREKLHHDTDAMRKLSKQALGEVQMKMAEEAEQRKRLERCGLRQKECRSAYEIIRNERSKYLKLIQTASQRISEMEEKYRLLNNEAEVLRGEEGVKEKALAKVRAEATKQRKIKEKLLKEYNSMTNTGHELNDEIEHNVACIDKSNSMIKKLERKLEDVDEKYGKVLENRNFAGVSLIDRNDELCVLWEKHHILEERTKEGSLAMLELSDDIRRKTVAVGQLRGELDVIKKQVETAGTNAGIDRQGERALESVGVHPADVGSGPLMVGEGDSGVVVQKMKEQLSALIAKSEELSRELENPSSAYRKWQELEGKDLDKEMLTAKIRLLEERLNDKKAVLVEKNMVLEELEPLCCKLSAQLEDGKEEKMALLQKVNSQQQNLRELTRKLIATVSELSMYQASAAEGKEEHGKLQALVDDAVERMREAAESSVGRESENSRVSMVKYGR